jgi:hypothetical protein
MERILVLADSRDYVRNNCFQMQLHKSLKAYDSNIRLDYFYISPKKARNFETLKLKLKTYQYVLSTLRQRVLFNEMHFLQKLIGDLPLRVYDQDPWENYIDDSPTNGCYTLLQNSFNLSNIFVTTNYWANYINKVDKIPSIFVKMGMLPELCHLGATQIKRGKSVEFKGSLHRHRREAFNLMSQNGQIIKINSEFLEYPKYLRYLQNLAIFVHDESGNWICSGEKIPMGTGLWIKDIEVASQGCFSIRNYSDESKTYSIENIPLIKFYDNPSEVKNIVAEIFSLSEKKFNEIQSSSVQYIYENNYWSETTNQIFNL